MFYAVTLFQLGGLLQETIQVLVKALKNAESQARAETMLTLRKILLGLGPSAAICHRDIYKSAKICLIDRSMYVRKAAAEVGLCCNFHVMYMYNIYS